MSDKAVVAVSLMVFYGPYVWIPFVAHGRWTWIKLWPLLPGMTTTLLIHAAARRIHLLSGKWPLIPVAVVVSLALFALTLFFVLRFPRRRPVTLGIALAISMALSCVAYQIYRA